MKNALKKNVKLSAFKTAKLDKSKLKKVKGGQTEKSTTIIEELMDG